MPGLRGWANGWGSNGSDRGVQYARIVPEAQHEPTYAYLEMDYGGDPCGSACGSTCGDGEDADDAIDNDDDVDDDKDDMGARGVLTG